MSLLFAFQTAFSLFMLVHAAQRGAPMHWWMIILMPFGEIAYFLAVYLPARKKKASIARQFAGFTERAPALEHLRREHRHTPSHDNTLRLAQGLFDNGKHREANEKFSELLAGDDKDVDALFGYAQSGLALGEQDAAIGALEHLLEQHLSYHDYAAAYQLCGLYWKSDAVEACLGVLERVCKKTFALEPRIQLARYLAALDRTAEARSCLESGLDALAASPPHTRRQQRTQAWKAKRLLKSYAN